MTKPNRAILAEKSGGITLGYVEYESKNSYYFRALYSSYLTAVSRRSKNSRVFLTDIAGQDIDGWIRGKK